jgi:hypothetical protein
LRQVLLSTLFATACLLAPAIAAAEEPIRIQDPIPLVDGRRIDPEIIESCDIQRGFTDALVRQMKGRIVAVPGPLDTSKGRALEIEIDDTDWSGNWFIGHVQLIRTHGTLYENGRKVASFTGVRNLRGDLTSACYNLTVGFRAHAWDIKRWLKDPVDGKQIGR